MPRSRTRDLLAGAVFIALGLAFALGSRNYELGTALQMGPGYVPLVLGGLLVVLGLVIAVQGLVVTGQGTAGSGDDGSIADTEDGDARIPWVAAVLLVAGIILFGLTVRDLGIVPALLITTLLSALAGHKTGPVAAAVIAVGLTALCVVIFVVLLQLRLPLLGPWLGG